MANLWNQATTTGYLRSFRIEIDNPLNGTPSIAVHNEQVFLDANGAPIANVQAGSWRVTQDQAAVDPVIGPLAYTLQTTLLAITQALYEASIAPPPVPASAPAPDPVP